MTWTWHDDDPATALSAQNMQTHIELRLRALEVAGGGGGGAAPLRGQFSGTDTTVSDFAALPWDGTGFDNETILDLTDPAAPVALVAGLWTVSTVVRCNAEHAGKFMNIGVDLDFNGEDAFTRSHSIELLKGSLLKPHIAVCSSYVIPVGGVLQVSVGHDIGADETFRIYSVIVTVAPS